MTPLESLKLGRPTVTRVSPWCCGKPHGCNQTHDGCLYLAHPFKRLERGEISHEECIELMGLDQRRAA